MNAQMLRKPFDKTLGIGLIICAVLIIPSYIYEMQHPDDQNAINIAVFSALAAFIIITILFLRTFVRVMDNLDDNIQKESTS